MYFALFFTLFIPSGDSVGEDARFVYALDTGMTGAECVAKLEAVTPAYAMMGEGWLSCEQDHGEDF